MYLPDTGSPTWRRKIFLIRPEILHFVCYVTNLFSPGFEVNDLLQSLRDNI